MAKTPYQNPVTGTQQPLSRAGTIFYLLPIMLSFFLFVGYGTLFFFGAIGGSADGDRVRIQFKTCAEAQPIMHARIGRMGLGEPVWSRTGTGLVLDVTLMSDPTVAKSVPTTLATPGQWAVHANSHDGEVLVAHADVTDWIFTLKELGNPLIQVELSQAAGQRLQSWQEAHPDDSVEVWLDDTLIIAKTNKNPIRGGLLELRKHGDDGREVLFTTNTWYIVLADGPLPCPAIVESVGPADEPNPTP